MLKILYISIMANYIKTMEIHSKEKSKMAFLKDPLSRGSTLRRMKEG